MPANSRQPVGERPGPYVIGLTGNIATGKSSVGRILVDLGAQHIDADRLAHRAMARGEPVWTEIVARFGRGILRPDGEVDRQKLGEIVFPDAEALKRLEAIVHPDVIARTKEAIARTTAAVIVVEAIKLIESGMMARLCNALWVVTAPRQVQIQRLVEQRGLARPAAVLRVDAQPPQSAKIRQADVVIENGGDWDELAGQVREAWQTIQTRLTVQ
jgi:dephospho-CoA kinase